MNTSKPIEGVHHFPGFSLVLGGPLPQPLRHDHLSDNVLTP
jgi:hypothetical protein